MAWKYPQFDIKSGYVVDIDPINDNLLGVANEVCGGLNEHNFNAEEDPGGLLTRDNMKTGAVFRVLTTSKATSNELPAQSDWLKIKPVDTWQSYEENGARLSFVSRGSTAWLCASFQIIATAIGRLTPLEKTQKGFGFLVALKLDGVVIHDALLGSGDPQGEFYRGFENRAGMRKTGVDKATQCTAYGGGGICGARLPVTVDAVVDLPPGEHVVEICVKSIQGHNWSRGTGASGDADSENDCFIASRELFVLEMRR